MVTQRNNDAVAECAACGRSITYSVGREKEFCSYECKRAGRSCCKFCGEPLIQPVGEIAKKVFCDNNNLCHSRYYRVGKLTPSILEEWDRTTCKACGKDLVQPKKGKRIFCDNNNICARKYRRAGSFNLSLTEKWGMIAPDTRKALREVEQLLGRQIGPGMATQLATAIDREYVLRDRKAHFNAMVKCVCKTCGIVFYRKPQSLASREYHHYKCQPKPPNPNLKLSMEQAEEIRNSYVTEHISMSTLAKKYSVGSNAIRDIVTYKSWKPERSPRKIYQNLARSSVKLTWEQVDEIRRLRAEEHLFYSVIGEKYGVSRSAICQIINYKQWKPEHDPRKQGNQ